jgi:hypothetical protein
MTPLEQMILEADGVMVRLRIQNTGDSEAVCRAVVAVVRSRVGKSAMERRERRNRWQAEYQRRMKAAAAAAGAGSLSASAIARPASDNS